MPLQRRHYDKFVQVRLTIELAGEVSAISALQLALTRHHNSSASNSSSSNSSSGGSTTPPGHAVAAAGAELSAAATHAHAASADLWVELRVWAEAVFQSVHQQFSVVYYGSEYTRRGANLDTARLPLSNAPYMRSIFANLSSNGRSEQAQWDILHSLAYWQDPGPAGFYDDLGELGVAAAHYVHNVSAETGDQALGPTPTVAVTPPSEQHYQPRGMPPPKLPDDRPRSHLTFVETTKCMPMYRALPIRLHYPHVSAGVFKVSVFFAKPVPSVNITVNGQLIVRDHPCMAREKKSFMLPAAMTAHGGALSVDFSSTHGLSVAEVWLTKNE